MTTHVVFALCLLASDLQHQDNFFQNASFEEDRDRDTYPDGWRPHAFDSPARLDWDDSVSRTGSRSLRISDSNSRPTALKSDSPSSLPKRDTRISLRCLPSP